MKKIVVLTLKTYEVSANNTVCPVLSCPPLSGLVSLNNWATAVESVMHLSLPWRMLRSQLVTCKTSDGMIDYYEWFNELAIKGPNTDVMTHQSSS